MQENIGHSYEAARMARPGITTAILIVGVFMAILDTSVVNIAIPTMESAFGATTNQIQWVLTGYMLVIGVLVPISGWLTDRVGAKRLFLFSLAAFTLGSVLCGMAWSTQTIIVFRIIQALGGGFMMPVSQAMMFRMYPPERRGMVMGLFGIAIMAAPAFGPALSGYLVEYANWRLIFYLNVPIGIVAFLAGMVFMHEFPHETHSKLDVWGFILSTAGFFSLLYGLNNVPADGWQSIDSMGFVVLGVLSLIALVIVELNIKDPVINLRVFSDYMFTMSSIIGALLNIALFAGIFLLPLYLQSVVGLSAIRTGLLMTPAALATAIMMPISGRLFDRIGARPLGLIGLIIITLATLGFTFMTRTTSVNTIQWYYILRSLGMGMVMMPVMTAGMNTLDRHLTSQGSAVSNTVRQVAASLGTAVLTSILTQRERFHYAVLTDNYTPFTAQGQHITHMITQYVQQGVPLQTAQVLVFSQIAKLISGEAFVEAMNDTFWIAAGLSALAWVLMLFFGSKKERSIREGHRNQKGMGAPPTPVIE